MAGSLLRLRLLLVGLLALGLASSASAVPMVLNFNIVGGITGGDNPGFVADATATFAFDDACVGTTTTFCTLTLTLRYNPSPGAPSQGETLTGVLFEPLGGADFRDGPPGNLPWAGSTAAGESLVGNGNLIAAGELGTIGGAGYINVSSHWGLNPALQFNGGLGSTYGSHFFGSVGDILTSIMAGNLPATTSTLGEMQMFGNNPSSIEPNPPNGSRFGILDVNSLPNGGFPSGNLAYIQAEVIANILYTGTLTGVNQVQTVFGTEGNPNNFVIPEPGTAALLGFGVLGLLAAGRRMTR